MTESAGDWYAVRMVFRALNRRPTIFEERITIWRATSFEEAIGFAEVEAADYADPEIGIYEYAGLSQAYRTFIPDRPPEHGDEIFSLMRETELDSTAYLNRFFDTGTERQRCVEGAQEQPADDSRGEGG